MIDVVKCKSGHFYDRNAYRQCPHCASGWLDSIDTINYRNEISLLAQKYLELYQSENLNNHGSSDSPADCIEKNIRKQDTSESSGSHDSHIPESMDDNVKTLSFTADSQSNYLVTGWLVCTDGPDTGYSFNLHYGYNSVGCDNKCQIRLSEDSEAAKLVHCSLVYEERKNKFYLVPEKEHATYLNNNCQSEIIEVQTGDLISIGKDRFEFIAFCNGLRKWSQRNI